MEAARLESTRREELDLRKEELAQQERARKEELAQQERARREELELRKAEIAQQEQLRRDEMALQRQELEALVERIVARSADASDASVESRAHSAGSSYRLKLDVCDDRTDIDSYLVHFERVVTANGWPRDVWGSRLAAQLQGKARSAFIRLTPEVATDYKVLKDALLEEYRRTPDFYRRQFRYARKQQDESFKQFLKRIEVFFGRWIALAKCGEDFYALYDLFLKEQLMNTMSPELASYVFERKPDSAPKAAEIAFEHLEARREAKLIDRTQSSSTGVSHRFAKRNKADGSFSSSSGTTKEDRTGPPKGKPPQSVHLPRRREPSDITCYRCRQKGHKQAECPNSQIKALGSTVTPLPTCGPPSSLCSDCEGKAFNPVGKCRVNGKEAISFRDSGADNLFVKPNFVNESDYTGAYAEVEMADFGLAGSYPTAYVDLDSYYLRDRVVAIVIGNMRPDIFIGNQAQLANGDWLQVPIFPRKGRLAAVQTRSRVKQAARPVKPVSVVRVGNLDISPQQVCVPKELRPDVLRVAHDTPMEGHLGAKKTRERIWSSFYWPALCSDVRRYCQSCVKCQKVVPHGRVARVPLGTMPLTHLPFERVGVDLVGPIKPAADSGARYILVQVDFATRYPDAVALKNVETETVAEALWNI